MEVHPAQLLQQVRQMVLPVPVRAVAGDILGDNNQLLHPPRRQVPGLIQHLFHGAAAVAAPEPGYDAEGAPVVAALSNAQVGVVGGRGQYAAALIYRPVYISEPAGPLPGHHRLYGGGDLLIAAGAQKAVRLGQLLLDLLLIPLGHTARDQDFFQPARLLQLRHMQDDADGLLAGGGKETAGVDDCHVRPGGVLLEDVPGGPAQLHHLFTVDHVFGAAQGNE